MATVLSEPRIHHTQSGDVPIAYGDTGRGDTALLCLPGWCSSRAMFAPVVPALSRRHRVLALDWRGHGDSGMPLSDFGLDELVADALAVIAAAGAKRIVPVATSHAGWVAIALRRRLGARVAKLVLLDWIVLEPPPPFLDALKGFADPGRALKIRDGLFAMWSGAPVNDEVAAYIRRDMGGYPAALWGRAGRTIAASYAAAGTPLQAIAALAPPPPTLHLYAQPRNPAYLAAQRSFAAAHPWFRVERLDGSTHFPTVESPAAAAAAIARFAAD